MGTHAEVLHLEGFDVGLIYITQAQPEGDEQDQRFPESRLLLGQGTRPLQAAVELARSATGSSSVQPGHTETLCSEKMHHKMTMVYAAKKKEKRHCTGLALGHDSSQKKD